MLGPGFASEAGVLVCSRYHLTFSLRRRIASGNISNNLVQELLMENLKFHESSAQQILPQTAAASDSHEPVKRSRSRIDSIDLLRRQKQGGGSDGGD